jgi:peptidoglycan L-alanyl-D-glutamate endopeptidase CwlK
MGDYFYSERSRGNLDSCDTRIIALFNEVIKDIDCTIICGRRQKAAQDEAYRLGRSTKKWPDSKHNKMPSPAVDAVPYPIDWIDLNRMAWFAGWVMRTASYMQLPLRWGGDWDMDTHVREHSLIDMPHFELILTA